MTVTSVVDINGSPSENHGSEKKRRAVLLLLILFINFFEEARGQCAGLGSLLPCGSKGPNSGYQGCGKWLSFVSSPCSVL